MHRWLGAALVALTATLLTFAGIYAYREDVRYHRNARSGVLEHSSGVKVRYREIMSRRRPFWQSRVPERTHGLWERGDPTGDFVFVFEALHSSIAYETSGARIGEESLRIVSTESGPNHFFINAGLRSIVFWDGTQAQTGGSHWLYRVQRAPNKSLQPTATAVTPPAAQEIVPAVAVAEH